MPWHAFNLIKYFKKKMLGKFSQKPKNAESAQEFQRFSSKKIVTNTDLYSFKDRKYDQSRYENKS
jgi:hypothetical protein